MAWGAAMVRSDRGPFGSYALDLYDWQLTPIPIAPGTKQPCIRFRSWWEKRPARSTIANMAERFPAANTGILTGADHGVSVTVVDADGDSDLVASLTVRHGETPLVTATPSGGRHLWYVSCGEGSRNLREAEGIPVDVKGRGGFVVVPPSVKAGGGVYRFEAGTWDDLVRLPRMANPYRRARRRQAPRLDGKAGGENVASGRGVKRGRRSYTLACRALDIAPSFRTEEALYDAALAIVRDHFEADPADSFTEVDVAKAVRWAWETYQSGDRWHGRGARTVVTVEEHAALCDDPLAFTVLMGLRLKHGARAEPFAVVPEAMAEAGTFPGLSAYRLRKAIRSLCERGALDRVKVGGRGPGDPHKYRLNIPAAKVSNFDPNIIVIPRPLASGLTSDADNSRSTAEVELPPSTVRARRTGTE